MKKAPNPILTLFIILSIASLACASLSGGNAPETEPASPTLEPVTEEPTATAKPTSTPRPTVIPTQGPQEFYTEVFDEEKDLDSWFSFNLGRDSDEESKLDISPSKNGLTFTIEAEDMYVYYIYTPFAYTDTDITLVAGNKGVNTNNISIVCRFDIQNETWYEFSFMSSGLWFLYAVDDGGYNTIDNGGSNDLNLGKAVNEFGLSCKGNTIAMSVNGKELKTYTDNKYQFEEGSAGFNISSLGVTPVIVEVQSFDIAKP
jgi:hypothetical protein